MSLAPTEAEWLEWTAAGDARTCCDCGARGHADDGVVADPTVAGSWLCEDCAVDYLPCDHCDTATDTHALVDCGSGREYCVECAVESRAEHDHYDWLRRTMP